MYKAIGLIRLSISVKTPNIEFKITSKKKKKNIEFKIIKNECFQLYYRNLNNHTYQCLIEVNSTSALPKFRRGLLEAANIDELVEQLLPENCV